jgi:formate/nitrite transporter FocA (FNT family)
LSPPQEEQAQELAATRAHIIHEVALREGMEEIERTSSSLAWSGLSAGLSISASLVAEGLLSSKIPNAAWSELIYKLGYPIGFVIVILGRQQFFTENTLTPIIPLLAERTWTNLTKVTKLWAIVLLSNIVGAALGGIACTMSKLYSADVRSHFLQISQSAASGSFVEVVLRGVMAGWLIALLTWVLSGVKHGEAALIFVLTYLIGLGNFSHVVAGVTNGTFLIVEGVMTPGHFLGTFLLPALIGNIIGGVGLVAILNHAQVVAGVHPNERAKNQ